MPTDETVVGGHNVSAKAAHNTSRHVVRPVEFTGRILVSGPKNYLTTSVA